MQGTGAKIIPPRKRGESDSAYRQRILTSPLMPESTSAEREPLVSIQECFSSNAERDRYVEVLQSKVEHYLAEELVLWLLFSLWQDTKNIPENESSQTQNRWLASNSHDISNYSTVMYLPPVVPMDIDIRNLGIANIFGAMFDWANFLSGVVRLIKDGQLYAANPYLYWIGNLLRSIGNAYLFYQIEEGWRSPFLWFQGCSFAFMALGFTFLMDVFYDAFMSLEVLTILAMVLTSVEDAAKLYYLYKLHKAHSPKPVKAKPPVVLPDDEAMAARVAEQRERPTVEAERLAIATDASLREAREDRENRFSVHDVPYVPTRQFESYQSVHLVTDSMDSCVASVTEHCRAFSENIASDRLKHVIQHMHQQLLPYFYLGLVDSHNKSNEQHVSNVVYKALQFYVYELSQINYTELGFHKALRAHVGRLYKKTGFKSIEGILKEFPLQKTDKKQQLVSILMRFFEQGEHRNQFVSSVLHHERAFCPVWYGQNVRSNLVDVIYSIKDFTGLVQRYASDVETGMNRGGGHIKDGVEVRPETVKVDFEALGMLFRWVDYAVPQECRKYCETSYPGTMYAHAETKHGGAYPPAPV